MSTNTKVTLSAVIQSQDLKLLPEVVESALKVYNSPKPSEPIVETAYGALPLSTIWDEESKLQLLTSEYATILQEVAALPKDCDKAVEVARIITKNAVLRYLADPVKTSGDTLL